MLFNSIAFALFLPIVFGLYWMLQRNTRVQNLFLLFASYVFYGWWDWRFLFLIAGCTAVNYIAAVQIASSRNKFVRRAWLVACCVVCLGALCVFKYYNFFVESFSAMCAWVGIHWSPIVLNIALPVGISFFTFQALSYTIDIMLGKLKPAENWVEYFVFIAFFPQLVAGPIERATNLLPQFQRRRRFDMDDAVHGVSLMVYGLFKKMVVADTLSQYVDKVFGEPMFYSSVTCIIGVVFFSIQVYCDFSGYSDVARGVARLFGFELMLNFDRPYLSKSFSEFWRRWHISLSSWFRDYVYIPLGGNRVSLPKSVRNLWIVFLLSGLWHGASWAFILWGALHALYLTIGVFKMRIFGRQAVADSHLRDIVSILIVDLGAAFAWIFFRAGTIEQSFLYLKALFRCKFETSLMALCAGIGPMQFGFCLVAIFLLAMSYFAPRDCRFKAKRSAFIFAACGIAAIIFLGMPSGGEFIYFRF